MSHHVVAWLFVLAGAVGALAVAAAVVNDARRKK